MGLYPPQNPSRRLEFATYRSQLTRPAYGKNNGQSRHRNSWRPGSKYPEKQDLVPLGKIVINKAETRPGSQKQSETQDEPKPQEQERPEPQNEPEPRERPEPQDQPALQGQPAPQGELEPQDKPESQGEPVSHNYTCPKRGFVKKVPANFPPKLTNFCEYCNRLFRKSRFFARHICPRRSVRTWQVRCTYPGCKVIRRNLHLPYARRILYSHQQRLHIGWFKGTHFTNRFVATSEQTVPDLTAPRFTSGLYHSKAILDGDESLVRDNSDEPIKCPDPDLPGSQSTPVN
ncbi:hypothetical protein TWF481_010985 [Arthrobotrys musiformis]|uniref:C2H2-type domain-containing protein n=1 Tax=Arthrobotrys musiformis TaxID=47236 RepID=A0AAV9VX23_9PEZI